MLMQSLHVLSKIIRYYYIILSLKIADIDYVSKVLQNEKNSILIYFPISCEAFLSLTFDMMVWCFLCSVFCDIKMKKISVR